MHKALSISLCLTLLASLGCSVFGIQTVEEIPYIVLESSDNKQIREYRSHIVAKTRVDGNYEKAQTKAFKVLAGYIFGKNQSNKRIAMTAPVQQSTGSSTGGQKIDMTAPVMQSRSAGGWEMSFMMPSKYKLEDLPKPKNGSIFFEEVSTKLMAAIGLAQRTRHIRTHCPNSFGRIQPSLDAAIFQAQRSVSRG